MPADLPPGVVVRAASAAEMQDFRFVNQISFGAQDLPGRYAAILQHPEWTTCVFDRGELATTFAAWPLSMNLNGRPAAIAGVSAVSTSPTRFRRGYMRAALEHALTEQRDRGQSMAVLYASQAAIYQRFGYAVCSTACSYEFDPRHIILTHAPSPGGELVVGNAANLPDEARVLRDLYRAFAAPRHGLLERDAAHSGGPDLWRPWVLTKPERAHGPLRCLLYEEEGETLGYMLYTNYEHPPYFGADAWQRNQRMDIREYAWLTPEAYVAIWQFVAQHDLVYRAFVDNAPEDDPIFHYSRDPRTLTRTTWDGLMVRIVDLARALLIRPYRTEGSATIRVLDALCQWNDATWTLDVGPQGSDVRQTDAEPDFSLDVHSMAQLITGHLSASYLARLGRIELNDRSALSRADMIFATDYRMHCMDDF